MLPFPQTRVPCGTAAPSTHVVNQLVPAQEVVLVPERAGGNNRNHPAGRVELKPRGGTNLLPRH